MVGCRPRIEPHRLKSIPDDSIPFAVRPASHRGAAAHQLGCRLRRFASISALLAHASNTLAISNLKMKTPTDLRKLSTGAGLLVLAIGFASLGFLSFIHRHPQDPASGLLFEPSYSIVGGLISILVGVIFFAIAVLFTTALYQKKAPIETG